MPKYIFDHYDKDLLRLRYEKHAKKPRIVWAGSGTHVDINNQNKGIDDFSHIEKFVKSTVDDYQWVFMGATPQWIKQEAKEGKVEVHPWVSIFDYPTYLNKLEPTIIFAPLYDDIFNRCKSNIKLTEAGAFGIAGVFQDLNPYEEAPLKFKTADELHDQIRFLLHDWDNYDKISTEMRKISEGYFIENNMELLKASYFTDIGSTERAMLSKKLIDIQKNV